MNQLFKNGEATTVFFDKNATSLDIQVWITTQLEFLGLNEAHSCSVSEGFNDKHFIIRGDEDSIVLSLQLVTPIKL